MLPGDLCLVLSPSVSSARIVLSFRDELLASRFYGC